MSETWKFVVLSHVQPKPVQSDGDLGLNLFMGTKKSTQG